MPDAVETKFTAGGVTVTVRIATPRDDPFSALSVFSTVLDQAMLVAAERVLVPELQKALSISGPPASSPFTPPHKEPPPPANSEAEPSDSPPLSESIGAWTHPDGGIAVGTVNKYGLYLEIGTQDMAPRPWLVPTLNRTDVMNRFNSAVQSELERLLAAASGDGAPAQPRPQGAVAG